eukprot:scaffold125675_cov31-Prasinocladus_malaysianus.AAC.1
MTFKQQMKQQKFHVKIENWCTSRPSAHIFAGFVKNMDNNKLKEHSFRVNPAAVDSNHFNKLNIAHSADNQLSAWRSGVDAL